MVLPKTLLPVYEDNLYNYLIQSLKLLEKPENNRVDSEVAYIYVDNDKNVYVSNNLYEVVKVKSVKNILNDITDDEGKFIRGKNVYYYNTNKTEDMTKIAITGSSYINSMRKEILKIILVVVGITFIIISLLVLIWSNNLVNRIKKLKDKVDNINNDDYDHKMIYDYDDELYTLEVAIENMRIYLKEQEAYKNQMYQNLSHDFKTPITVMKSYIEAMEDGIETK